MYHYGAGTNVGNVRDNNEDSYVCDDEKDLWIVADGMGGLGFGEVASAITTYTVSRQVRSGHGINQAIELAHKNIKEYAQSDGLGTNMGTTIVLLLSHGSLYNIFWVGDSRAYLLDTENMKQVTVDHSLVQSLIDQGELTKEEAITDPRKNAVTRALGVQELETVRADSISERWKPGQKILLCSDGLTDCVSDADIEKLMRQGGDDQDIVDRLIEAALEGGGKDNVTVIVISAPATSKIADTDTYVPAGTTGDDTHVPILNDTQPPRNDTNGSNGKAQAQLSLNLARTDKENQSAQSISGDQLFASTDSASGANRNSLATIGSTTAPTTFSEPSTKKRSRKRLTKKWQQLSGAAAAAFFLLVIASLQFEEPTTEISQNFIGLDISPAKPITRNFPQFHFPSGGKMLQVGLFKLLQGAESHQSELTSLGLAPHIEKRTSNGSVSYAVVIGPLDESDHQIAMMTLEENKLTYFHREARGS